MRQGGMKPKSHSSGTYWVRANAQGGGGKTKTKKQIGIDVDGDGEADYYIDEDTYNQSPMQLWANVITKVVIMIGVLGVVVSMFFA